MIAEKAQVAAMQSSRPRQRGSEESEDRGVHVAMKRRTIETRRIGAERQCARRERSRTGDEKGKMASSLRLMRFRRRRQRVPHERGGLRCHAVAAELGGPELDRRGHALQSLGQKQVQRIGENESGDARLAIGRQARRAAYCRAQRLRRTGRAQRFRRPPIGRAPASTSPV